MEQSLKKYLPGNKVHLLRGGKLFFDQMEALIDQAQHEIHFHTYIFATDQTGLQISHALLRAAQRKVKIYMVLDAYGSLELMRQKDWAAQWKEAGIEIKWFGKFFTGENINFGRRLHQKIFIVDGRDTIVCGLNIADRYNNIENHPAWLDFGLHVTGPIGIHLREHAMTFLPKKTRQGIQRNPKWLNYEPNGNVPVMIIRNDWLRGVYDIYNTYRNAFDSAQKEIIIAGAYFTPGRRMRNSLQRAVKSKVNVKVILSKQADNWIAENATKYLYSWLLRNKMEIFEWKPTIMHAKVAVIDRKWTTLGSYNLNYLSAYESIELNYALNNKNSSTLIHNELEKIINHECTPVTLADHKKYQTPFKMIQEWVAYRLFRFIVRMLLLIGRRKTIKKN